MNNVFTMILKLFILIFFMNNVIAKPEVPVVQTKFGAVRGVYEEDENGQYFMYMDIPYGQPPKDNLFGDPIDPDPWDGILEANSDSSKCPQREEFNKTLVGGPHCLHLNVYVPANLNSTDHLAVLLWIHGGGLTIGFKSRYQWGPEYLIRHNIIMVAVNYRLGPYGFMCLGTEKVPGNAGLKDVSKSLRWVHENIAAFGGDPDKIVLGGSSAGGFIVEYLFTSAKNSGLYQRAILQSGSGFLTANKIMNKTSHNDLLRMANHLGFDGDTDDSLEFLQSVHHFDVILAVEELELAFDICVEPDFDGTEPFFIKGHTETIVSENMAAVDVLTGFNCEESPFRVEIIEDNVIDLLELAISSLSFENEDVRKEVMNILRRYYMGTKPLSEDLIYDLTRLRSDYRNIAPAHLSLNNFIKHNITAYLYDFCFNGGRNFSKHLHNITFIGASHADEIGYLFKQGGWENAISEDDSLIIDRMTIMWTNFIKYGNPTPEETEILPVEWFPYKENMKNYLFIDKEMYLGTDALQERMEFWNLLVSSYFDIWHY